MKYLLVLGVVLFGIWLWGHNRRIQARERAEAQREARAAAQRSKPTSTTPSAMVACVHCGLHLPLTDAVQGTQGPYCSHGHRRAHEG